MKKIIGSGIVFILLISAYQYTQTMEQDFVIAAEMQGIGLGTNSGTAFDMLSIFPVLMASEEISNYDAEEVPSYDSDEVLNYVSEEEERLSAFGKVLWDAYLKGTLPDGYSLDYHDGVDAWNKEVREEDYDGTPFPTEIDADGDGIVYSIFPADDTEYRNTPLVDGPAYEAWRNAYLGGAEEIPITYRKLTEENIAALGCPKPDVPLPQPVG